MQNYLIGQNLWRKWRLLYRTMLQPRCLNRRQLRRLQIWAFTLLAVTLIIFCLSGKTSQRKEELRLEKHRTREFIDVKGWLENPTVGCNGNFYGYGEEFVRLRYARINSKSGTFYLPCESDIPKYNFDYGREGTPLKEWLKNMLHYSQSQANSLTVKETTTIAIMRIEAHNLYHTMCEWYNVFILSKLLKFNSSEVEIVFMDDRPPGHMDETWDTLFKKVTKYSSVEPSSAFKDLLWNAIGYESPMNHHFIREALPYLREFRKFFLDSFNIQEKKTLDCEKLTVTVILRRDYMTHPERLNMTGGLVHRKFENENEILQNVKLVFAEASINIVILEEISMSEQLRTITNTDVLIGMHGAAMTHILFLPKHAVVFEMFPKYWGFYHHFKAMARWRNIKYFGWQNMDDDNEFSGFYTRIPSRVIIHHCRAVKDYICGR